MLTFLLEQVVEITLVENGYMYHLMETALNELGFVLSTFEVIGSDHGDAQARVRLMILAEKKCLRDAVGPVAPPAVGALRRLVARDVPTPAKDIDKSLLVDGKFRPCVGPMRGNNKPLRLGFLKSAIF